MREQKRKKLLNVGFALRRYREGATDAEIAREADVCKGTVQTFRKKYGLEATVDRNARRPKHRLTPLEHDAADARAAGMTYGQYKAQFYVPAVRTRRK